MSIDTKKHKLRSLLMTDILLQTKIGFDIIYHQLDAFYRHKLVKKDLLYEKIIIQIEELH